MSKTKPTIKGCGCWSWCETCKGAGEVPNKNKWIFAGGRHIHPNEPCTECKGKPQTLKHCADHAKAAGFDTGWRAGK